MTPAPSSEREIGDDCVVTFPRGDDGSVWHLSTLASRRVWVVGTREHAQGFTDTLAIPLAKRLSALKGVSVAEPLSLDLLDDEVPAFGMSVGEADVEEGQDLRLPGPQGLGEAVRLGDVVGAGPPVPVLERGLAVVAAVDVVDVVQHLLERPCALKFVSPIGAEGSCQPGLATIGETLEAADEVTTHCVERITLAASVTGESLLEPTAAIGDGLGGETFDVEAIRDRTAPAASSHTAAL